MKIGICMVVVMVVVVSSGVMVVLFSVSSNDMCDGQLLVQQYWFVGFGCIGGNVFLQLVWKNVLVGMCSFVVIVQDFDVFIGSGWWYWMVVNIVSSVFLLFVGVGDKNSVILLGGVVQGCNDFGYVGFGGVCLLVGDKLYCYCFMVWVLDVFMLLVDVGVSGVLVGYLLYSYVFVSVQLMVMVGC